MAGLTIAHNQLALQVSSGLPALQGKLSRTTRELSTGLRVNSPEDDPAGYSIATNMQTQVKSYDTAVQSMQNTSNALTVQTGAMSELISITQRIRGLSIEANDSLKSTTNLQDIQTEITQLVSEYGNIIGNTTFNGVKLFSESIGYQTPSVVQTASATFNSGGAVGGNTTSVTTTLVTPPSAGDVLVAAVVHGDGWGGGGGPGGLSAPAGWNLVQNTDNGTDNGMAVFTHVVTAADTGIYTFSVTTTLPGNTLSVVITEVNQVNTSTPIAAQATTQLNNGAVASPLMTGSLGSGTQNELPLAFFGVNPTTSSTPIGAGWTNQAATAIPANNVQYQTASLTTAGQTEQTGITLSPNVYGISVIMLMKPQAGLDGDSITTPTGAAEGDTETATLVPLDPYTLGISQVDVTTNAASAETACDAALQTLTSQQAILGAYSVRLGHAMSNAELTSVNLTASASQISDANIAQVSVENTRDSILMSYSMSLLAQANVSSHDVLELLKAA